MDVLGSERDFTSLSVKDLLEARDLYHWHLLNKENVVGTAIGLYLIRTSDPWPDERHSPAVARRTVQVKPERTLENSEVRDYSWPCVIVLVDHWTGADEFGMGPHQVSPEELVPKTLYLPDGRTVPVCVVKVTRTVPDSTLLPPRTWPAKLGGGFPLLTTVQGESRVASVGVLVTDGHTTYALTSRHVAGPAGQPVDSMLGGRQVTVGRSSGRQLTRRPFSEVYVDFPGRRTFLTLDAGLIEVDDVGDWTSRTFGLPAAGELADLNELNISLRLIGAEVRAFGAATGSLGGRIAALFHRYRSIGGYDDVTDFLIAAEPGQQFSRPGDSGTVWHLVEAGGRGLRPIALEWGGQAFLGASGRTYNFTLAASLTNVLRLLEVDLVVGHNVGAHPFWGKTGHYTVATLACEQVGSDDLARLMRANTDRISFPDDGLGHTAIDESTITAKKNGEFVPLADVPDLIWKNLPTKVKGGRDTAFRSGPEHPCHYADIDEPRPGDQQTLRALCIAQPANLTVAFWQSFYTALGHTAAADRGLLPFRVWQFFDAMVAAVTADDLHRYLAAAGLLAHYVGDACQPLHGSYLSDGLSDGTGKGVHSAYETVMIDRHDAAILAALPAAIGATDPPGQVTTGQQAAVAIVELMDRTAKAIDPAALVNAYAAVAAKPDDHSIAVTNALWAQFGESTIGVLADGVRTLAMIWTSAWNVAGGDQRFSDDDLGAIDKRSLQLLYEDATFVPSVDLDHIAGLLN